MSINMKHQLKDKARYTYGLVSVLKCDIDILRKDASECNLDKIRDSIREVDTTLRKLMFVIGEIEYILKLDEKTTHENQF